MKCAVPERPDRRGLLGIVVAALWLGRLFGDHTTGSTHDDTCNDPQREDHHLRRARRARHSDRGGIDRLHNARRTPASPAAGSLEEVYVWHSIREPHTSEIAWCSVERTGFAPYPSEAEPNRMFSFWSIEVRSPDGRVVNAKAAKAAEGRACFGPTSDPSTIHFYAEGSIGAVTYTGAGDCRVLRADIPEKGIVLLRCTLHLRNLPPPYVGGVLVSNTLSSKAALGADTDPPGYAQSSFATVRLWKAR